MVRGGRGNWIGFGGRPFVPVGAPAGPSWVPANAKIHIDFLGGTPQGRAWSNGAEVAINTLLGSDDNASGGWGTATAYSTNPLALSTSGYGGSNALAPAMIGVLLSNYLAGCTFRIKFSMLAAGLDSLAVGMVAVNGNDALEMVLRTTTDHRAYIGSWNGSLMVRILNIVNIAAGSINIAAFTISGTRAELSVNGSAPVTGVIAANDRPPGNPLVAALIDHKQHRIQSLTLYDPLPTTGGLSELSNVA